MLLYLDARLHGARRAGRTRADDLREAIVEGAAQRIRPKMMTVDHDHGGPRAGALGARGPAPT